MWLLPYDLITIRTQLTPEQIVARLADVVGTKPLRFGLFAMPNSAPYEGGVGVDEFEITRIDYYYHFTVPKIHGQIRHIEGYTQINLTVSPRPITYLMLVPPMIMAAAIFCIPTAEGGSVFSAMLVSGFVILFAYMTFVGSAKLIGYFDIALLRGLLNDLDRSWGKRSGEP